MKKVKRILIGLFLSLALALSLLAGCSVGFDDEDEGGNGQDNVEGRTTIRVAVSSSQTSEASAMRKFKQAFEKVNSTINIKIEPFSDYTNAMYNYIANDAWPDVVWTAGDQHSVYSEAGHFVDLKDYYETDPDVNVTDYYDVVMQSTHYNPEDTGIWFAPRDYNKPTLIVNKAIFAAADVAVPDYDTFDYEAFLSVCKDLRAAMDAGKTGANGIRLKPSNTPVDANLGWSPVLQSVIKSFGGSLYDTANKTISLNSAASVEAYKQIGELIQKRYVVNPNASQGSFISGDAAMAVIVRPDLLSTVQSVSDYDFLPFPFAKVGAGCSGYAIAAKSQHKDLAWEFLKFIITEPGQELFGSMGTGVPALKALETTGKWLSYGSGDLHHKAFVANQDRDFSLNDIDAFPFNKRKDIKTEAESVMTQLGKADTWKGSPLENGGGSWSDDGDWSKLLAAVNTVYNKANSKL